MDKNLNVVTYNIHHGLKAVAIIKNLVGLVGQGADIFCLQEVRVHPRREFIIATLLKELGPKWKAECLTSPHAFDLGLCTLWDSSKLEALSFEPLLLPKLKKLYAYEKAFATAKEVMNFKIGVNKHNAPTQRAALIGNFKFAGKSLCVANIHLDWQGGFKHRSEQLKCLSDYLAGRPKSDGEIICGDFNSLGFYKFYKRRNKKITGLLGRDFKNAFHKKPTTSYLQTLDHIFVKNMFVSQAKAIKYKGSDHFPLLAELKL